MSIAIKSGSGLIGNIGKAGGEKAEGALNTVESLFGGRKPTGSTEGHARAASSPLQAARVADAPRRLDLCRRAILARDFQALAEVVELDSNLMHAVMITSSPALLYWPPATLELMQAVTEWRRAGWPVCYTVDAGPNVHVICPAEEAPRLQTSLTAFPGVERVLTARPGGPARLIQS